MPDFHAETIKFLNILLKTKQLEMADSVHYRKSKRLKAEFERLRQRLCLEIVYAIDAES